ncbi:MAG: TonB-dependent receptor, partial [Longimicrobiales bacterium]
PLAYIPNSANDLQFTDIVDDGVVVLSAEAQAQAFDNFIQNDDYLGSRRGQYAERNAQRTPFEHVIDLRLAQELFANFGGRRNTLEVTLDIFNLTNLLNSEWGLRYNPGFRTVDLLEFERFAEEDAVAGDDLTPIYTFRFPTFGDGVQSMDEFWETEILDFGTYGSRWQMQIGLRYSF